MTHPMTRLRPVGIAGLASAAPARWVPAAEIAEASGIPEPILTAKFGLAGKHVAAEDEHVSDMSVAVGTAALADAALDPTDVDAVVYFGSTWKDHPVWQAAPAIAHRLGCTRAFALELDYVSCGATVALRVARDLLRAEPDLRTVLLAGASRESHLLDYHDADSRFAFTFGDGAAAAVLVGDHPANQVLGCAMRTDGALAHHVKVPAGGSREPATVGTVTAGRHHLTVEDLPGMREALGAVSLESFVGVARDALAADGLDLADVDHLCGIHLKPSMHAAICTALGIDPTDATYLEDTGHMSGIDPLFALDRARRSGRIADGDLVLLLAAGTGYTWAATTIRWGQA